VKRTRARRLDRFVVPLLAVLPVLAYLPALAQGRLLGPGDGAALHYPLRTAVWQYLREGALPGWNHSIFGGTPLLGAYRHGALHPATIVLALLPDFIAFQCLVLFALSASGVLMYLYLRRLGCSELGGYFGGLSFALGPYLVGHLADTATIVAAPSLLLMLLSVESLLARSSIEADARPHLTRAIPLAASVALLALSGSVEALVAGAALLVGRLLLAPLGLAPGLNIQQWRRTLFGALAGAFLAAPALLPALYAFTESGHESTGLAGGDAGALPGAAGLVLRYVSHTPAAALALTALPLALRPTPVRALAIALGVWTILQWGRGPLAAPGSLALLFDLTLSLLAGLSLTVQWRSRHNKLGHKLRLYFLFWSLACAAGLSLAAAAAGPLSPTLASPVGLLALSLVLYFWQARQLSVTRGHIWLLPLTVSFLLQPQGRLAWTAAPTRAMLEEGTSTSAAITDALGPRHAERILTLARRWPRDEEFDLGYANLAILSGRRTANGYDPLTPLRNRTAFEEMGPSGTLSETFFRTDPRRLELLGLGWIQAATASLASPVDDDGLGELLELVVEPGRPRFLALPIVPANEIRLVANGPRPRVSARLATGRLIPATFSAVRQGSKHPCLVFSLPGRYSVDGVKVEAGDEPGRLMLTRVSVIDDATGLGTGASAISGYVSDRSRLREAATTPFVRLFEITASPGLAHVAEALWVVSSEDAVLGGMRALEASGLHPGREAIALEEDVAGITVPTSSRASRALLARARGGNLDVRASGPGLLVIAEGWDRGWSAAIDSEPTAVLRVNHAQMAVVLEAGVHRVTLRYQPRGFYSGLVLAVAASLILLVLMLLERRRSLALPRSETG